jgi:hypothetical protein
MDHDKTAMALSLFFRHSPMTHLSAWNIQEGFIVLITIAFTPTLQIASASLRFLEGDFIF